MDQGAQPKCAFEKLVIAPCCSRCGHVNPPRECHETTEFGLSTNGPVGEFNRLLVNQLTGECQAAEPNTQAIDLWVGAIARMQLARRSSESALW